MDRIKVLSIFGTRPEGIKMCPLVKALEKDDRFESIVCTTGQHREMLDSVLKIFDVIPDYDLNLMKHGQTIIDISNKVLRGVDCIIKKTRPNIILVHGDTSTTLNAALAAFYNKVPIGHVEAGLRTYNMYSPFPEEANRRLTTAITSLHFAPTQMNKENLLKENIDEKNIYVTGNTVIDALLSVIDYDLVFSEDVLNKLDYKNKKIILLTTHRRENWGEPMENIFKAIIKVVENNPDVEVVFPIHKNQNIRSLAHRYFDDYNDKIHILEPLEYVEFANLMSRVYLIMSDSGGVQEEAPVLKKPVIVLRDTTERPEALLSQTIILGGTTFESVYRSAQKLLTDKDEYDKMANAKNPYGDGTACKQIIESIIKSFLDNKDHTLE